MYCIPIEFIPNCISYIFIEEKGLICKLCEKGYVKSYSGKTCTKNIDTKALTNCLGYYFSSSTTKITSCEIC